MREDQKIKRALHPFAKAQRTFMIFAKECNFCQPAGHRRIPIRKVIASKEK